jgi:hypothetical protein
VFQYEEQKVKKSTRETQLKLYKFLAGPVLLQAYGSEAWVIRKRKKI